MSSSQELESGNTADGLPVDSALGPTLEVEHVKQRGGPVDRRVAFIGGLCILIALAAGLVAQGLGALIALCTNIAFYGRLSLAPVSPAGHQLGLWSIFIPVIGGLIIGVMARYGSRAIRGHGIPEAMEQVLTNESRIPKRMTVLKPLSSAISIGTGGPFGAEGPIIATGGAMGSVLGQFLRVSAAERKTLLAAGAAAGMAATFGSPVSAVLLAVELLLFEYRPRSLIPVALAATAATGVRVAFVGADPAFGMTDLVQPSGGALAAYVVIGGIVGLASVLVTRAVYKVEDGFEKLPLHWMWWPAIGGLAVGIVGVLEPKTMGVGYDNIEAILSGQLAPKVVLVLCGLKFVSWVLALGSGTSGGTLAPLFTFGGGVGAVLGVAIAWLAPALGMDPRLAALVGMSAMFAGASRALLASVVFAFETTRQPIGLLPLLGGCSASFLVSSLLMQNSIMTEKITRRGVRVLGEYSADHLDQLSLRQIAVRSVVTLRAASTLTEARAFLASASAPRHQGYPLVDDEGGVVGVLTQRDLRTDAAGETPLRSLVRRGPVVISEECSLRDAADCMARERLGRLPVMSSQAPHRLVGIVTRTDLIHAHAGRLAEQQLKPRKTG